MGGGSVVLCNIYHRCNIYNYPTIVNVLIVKTDGTFFGVLILW